MKRFRYAGWLINTPWKVSLAIKALGQQIEDRWPSRHPADGTLASGSHTKWPASDHGRDPKGVVRAIDIGVYLGQGDDLFAELRRSQDPRIRYVIHKNQMFSSYPAHGKPPWALRPYTKGGHDRHVHVSVLTDSDVDTDDSHWDIGDENVSELVKKIQLSLKRAGFLSGTVDGVWGPKTQAASDARDLAAATKVELGLETETVRVVKSVKVIEND